MGEGRNLHGGEIFGGETVSIWEEKRELYIKECNEWCAMLW
jgi:hypothetical protein